MSCQICSQRKKCKTNKPKPRKTDSVNEETHARTIQRMELQLCCCCLFYLWNLKYSSNTTKPLHAPTPATSTHPPLFFSPTQQPLRISRTRDKKVCVAKLGFSMSWDSISRPFSLVVTEHMLFLHMVTTVPTAGEKRWSSLLL